MNNKSQYKNVTMRRHISILTWANFNSPNFDKKKSRVNSGNVRCFSFSMLANASAFLLSRQS